MPSVQKLATLAATTSREGFLAELGGEAALVRLDERGGRDEPAPWAFHAPPSSAGPASVSRPPREDEAVDVETLRGALDEHTQKMKRPDMSSDVFGKVSVDEETKTQALPAPALPVPPARGAATVHVVRLTDGRARVGRSSSNEIEIGEMSLSREHAALSRAKGESGFVVRDAGSRNGTRVNGRALERGEERKLRSGDVVAFGDVECLFLDARELFTHLARMTD